MPPPELVSPDEALARVRAALADGVSEADTAHGSVALTVEPGNLVDVMTILRDADGLRCRFFTFLSAIDRSEFGGPDSDENGGLEVLVHVYSPETGIHVNVHVPVDAGDPKCPSITGVYMGANWHERETHEMFGIDFEGHPLQAPLYLSEDFEGHPLLRAFKLPSRFIKEWPGAKDPEEAAAGGH